MTLPAGTRVERYVIEASIAEDEGGAASYVAVDPELGRRVELLVLPDEEAFSPTIAAARLQARLPHPNVLVVYDVGRTTEGAFVAFERFAGEPFPAWCARRHGREATLGVLLAAGRALAAAHAAGIAHGAFDGSRVVVGADGTLVRVRDFGQPADAALVRADLQALARAIDAVGAPSPRVRAALDDVRTGRVASVEALLAALEPPQRTMWRRFVAAAALGALALVAWRAGLDRTQLCSGAAQRLAGAWDPARRAAVEQALIATGRPYAAGVAASVVRALDGYADAWAGMHREACEATRVARKQPEDVLDLRMRCLEERRGELAAVTALLSHADAAMLDRAPDGAGRLPAIAACADVPALRSGLRQPRDAGERAKVDAIRGRVARARAAFGPGRWTDGKTEAEGALAEARALGFRPAIAEAAYSLGTLENALGKPREAEAAMRAAVEAAEAERHDQLVARAWVGLLFVVGAQPGRPDLAEIDRSAAAAIERLGGHAELEAARANHLGTTATRAGKLDEAAQHFERGLAGFRKALGPDSPQVGRVMANLSLVLLNGGRYEDGAKLATEGLTLFERVLGPDHPEVAVAHERLVELLGHLGRHKDALPHAERALAIREGALGKDHPDVTFALSGLGTALRGVGNLVDAERAHRRELALLEKQLGPDDPEVAGVLDELGTDERDQKKLDRALATFQRALAIRKGAKAGVDPRDLGQSWFNVGETERQRRRFKQAADALGRSRALLEKALGAGHPEVATVLLAQGELALDRGKPAEAIAPLERALEIRKSGDPLERADVEVALAKALAFSGRDGARARALAEHALATFRAAGASPPAAAEAQRLLYHLH